MDIVKLQPGEIEIIRPLWEALNRHHKEKSNFFKDHFATFTFDQRLDQLKTRDATTVFAARQATKTIGYCIASIKDGTGEIDSIFILPEYRKTGIGDCLMTRAESWLKTKNAEKIHISVIQGNESVFGFYRRHGYLHRFSVLEKKT